MAGGPRSSVLQRQKAALLKEPTAEKKILPDLVGGCCDGSWGQAAPPQWVQGLNHRTGS